MNPNPLLVKLSSMGDVVHSFPALSDAAAHGFRFDWVVEEAFVEMAAMHPAVDRVVPFGLRRWRRSPGRGIVELGRFARKLRAGGYVTVLDAQGLVKSAVVTRLSGARHRHGLARDSAREPASTRAYTHTHQVSRDLHAIDRLRVLFAATFDYAVDLGVPAPVPFASPPASQPAQTLLVHGTTWTSKEYPEAGWRALIEKLAAAGHRVALLSGSAAEHERALRLAGAVAEAIPPASLLAACERISTARLVIGVDSGLTHLAAVLGRPTVGLYGATSAQRTGVRGPYALDLVSAFECSPCLQRSCGFQGVLPTLAGANAVPACFAELTPERITTAAAGLLADTR